MLTGPRRAPAHADIVVVGGGVIGLSIAFHVAEAGHRVALFERGELGSGASDATAGVVRTYFPGDPINAAVAAHSMKDMHNFTHRPGADPRFEHTGFLVLFTEQSHVDTFSDDAPAQRAAGAAVELLDPQQAAARNPHLSPTDIIAAAWAPDAYTCDPRALIHGYAQGATRLGAQIHTAAAVRSIDLDEQLVHTSIGTTAAETIVCAAGPWSAEVAAMVGVRLSIAAPETELLVTDPLPHPVSIPLTLHHASGLRMRALGQRLLVGMGRPDPGESHDHWRRRVQTQLVRLCPSLRNVRLRTAWAGTWDATPDRRAVLGDLPTNTGRVLCAAGFSGHGLCQAPTAGEVIRQLYHAEDPPIDISPFSATRLAVRQPERSEPQ